MNCRPSKTLSELRFQDPGSFVPRGQASGFFDPTQATPLQSPTLRAPILLPGMLSYSPLVCQALLGPQHPPSPGILAPEPPECVLPSLTARLETVDSLSAQLHGPEPDLLPSLAQAMGSWAGSGPRCPHVPLTAGAHAPKSTRTQKRDWGAPNPCSVPSDWVTSFNSPH